MKVHPPAAVILRLSLFALLLHGASSAQVFRTARSFPAGPNPVGAAAGDFNHDGKLDIAVADNSAATVSILLGNGDGTFAPLLSVPVADDAYSVATADFNHDSNLDLAVGTNTGVNILLGRGDGSFQPAVNYAVGTERNVVELADFNKDGNLDIAVGAGVSQSLFLLMGKSDGTFLAPRQIGGFGIYGGRTSFGIGDFNHDGRMDLAMPDAASQIEVLLGNGDGTFQAAVNYAVEPYAYSVSVADLNGDGNLDIAVLQCGPHCDKAGSDVGLLVGNGDGTFHNEHNFIAAAQLNSMMMTTADINADGKTDLVVANYLTNDVSIFLNDGTHPSPAENWLVGGNPQWVVAGDFKSDGTTDLAVTNNRSNDVSILLGKGASTFSAARNFPLPDTTSFSVVTGDFNEDGKLDMAIADYHQATVAVMLATVKGNFTAPVVYPFGAGPTWQVATGDFNGDHHLDLVGTNYGGKVGVLLGNGDGTFQPAVKFPAGPHPVSVAVADFNGDARQDLVVANQFGSLSILLGQGDGTFSSPSTLAVDGSVLSYVLAADFNHDGKADLAVIETEPNQAFVLLGNGNGTFQTGSASVTLGNYPQQAVAADLNHDGVPDLAVLNVGYGDPNGTVSILLSQGDGTFQAASTYSAGVEPQAVAVADFNEDGYPDFAVSSWQTGQLVLFAGQANSTFKFAQNLDAGSAPLCVAIADFHGDGRPDLVVTNQGLAGTVAVLLNRVPKP